MQKSPPRLIALCGNPTCGKTTAAELIGELYGHRLLDDGLPLRRIAVDYLGLTEHQAFTQPGKLEKVMLNGREWRAREILGEIGNAFEEKFGGDIIPIMSYATTTPDEHLVIGSVRREQGLFWRNKGALVLEIVNPLADPSPYEFDKFNPAHCHARVLNDGQFGCLPRQDSLDLLKARLAAAIEAF